MNILEFQKIYPSEETCLDEIFRNRFGHLDCCTDCGVITRFYRIKKRKCYKCPHCGFELHPLSGTIFHKSSTSLRKWFFAIYLFSNSRNGVAAKELERHLGVTYKTAWRMAKQIRSLMGLYEGKLSGIVEADETYIGGVKKRIDTWNKPAVLGLAQRGGQVRAKVADPVPSVVLPFINNHLTFGAELHTDESRIYHRVSRTRVHQAINHSKGVYSKDGVTTNSLEGFWSQMKRSLDGTYHSVSPKYLQLYVDEFVYRYNHRRLYGKAPIYPFLLAMAEKPIRLVS